MTCNRKPATAAASILVLGAGIGIGACSSSSSGPVTGTETFAGTEVLTPAQIASSTFQPTIPLTASGLFSDTGSIHLSGGNAAGPTSIKLKSGDINIHHAATSPNLQPKLVSGCTYAVSENVAYTVTGGASSYANVTGGNGTATVTESFTMPRSGSGCANPSNAAPASGSVSFKAVGPITRSS